MDGASCIWQRALSAPLFRAQPESVLWKGVTNPDVFEWNDTARLYACAYSASYGIIRTCEFQPEWLQAGASITLAADAPIAVDRGPQAFDSVNLFDPAALLVGEQVYLYYSAIGPDADTIGLAISDDGALFRKRDAPVFEGRAPEVVRVKGRFHLLFVRKVPPRSYAIFAAVSPDGEAFSQIDEGPVLDHGASGAWDRFEVSTPRIFERGGVHYMIYAGQDNPERPDRPRAFGLARSFDLLSWERYPRNPVFSTGAPGTWDDGAIWYGTVWPKDDRLYLLYEGSTRTVSRGRP